jgi:hypothetical protein
MPPESEEKLAAILTKNISELATLDRYERRTLSRRKAAIRNFDASRVSRASTERKLEPAPKRARTTEGSGRTMP